MSGITTARRIVHSIFDTRIYDLLYECMLVMWLFISVLAESRYVNSIPHHGSRMLITLIVVVAYFVFRWRFNPKSVFVEMGVACVALTAFAYDYISVGMGVCMMYCARGLDYRRLLKISLVTITTAVAIVVASSLIGIIPDVIYKRGAAVGLAVDRHCFGFSYTTFLSHYLFCIFSMICYLKRFSLTPAACGLMLLADVVVYLYTDSKTAFALTLILILICIPNSLRKRGEFSVRMKGPAFKMLLGNSFLIICAISAVVLLVFPYGGQIGSILNKLLSERVRLTQESLTRYPLTLFGQQVNWSTTQYVDQVGFMTGYRTLGKNSEFVQAPYLYVDCSYFNLLVTQGVVPFALVLGGLTCWTRKVLKDGDDLLLVILLLFAIKAAIDPQLLYVHYCPFLLGAAAPLGMLGIKAELHKKRVPKTAAVKSSLQSV